MWLEDMTSEQREDEKSFREILTLNGWDAEDTANLLHAGTFVDPEGVAFLETHIAYLTAKYYAETQHLILTISAGDAETDIDIKLNYLKMTPILSWLVDMQNRIQVENAQDIAHKACHLCTHILIGDHAQWFELDC